VSDSNDTERALKLWVVLARAHAAVADRVRADLVRHGLTSAEFGVLEALYHKGPMLLGEVQKKILVSSGGITYLMDRLVKKGYAERTPCPEDGRASYAELTAEGAELIGRVFPEHATMLRGAMAGLNEEEKEEAIRLVRKLGLHAVRRGVESSS
jgi:MarR family 2-MHQ and catechol resistance regulon transcriptional repressor